MNPSSRSLITNAVDLGTVLGIWAHPDDEAFLSAGLMAAASDAGQRVVCVTATLGEHGTDDPQRWPPQRLARVRTHEARASLAALGVTEHHLLGISDGTCAAQPPDTVVRRLAQIIHSVAPDTILTFGPDGMSGHEDHQTVSRWATAARAAAAPHARLLYATTTEEFVDRWLPAREVFTMFPGFRVMAMSMEGLEIDRAGVSSIPVDMVDLKLVSMVEEQFTGGAAPALLFEQGGQSRPDRRVLPASLTPRHPIPIVRTAIACDFRVAQPGGVPMGGEGRLTRTGGWRGQHLAGCLSVPVPVRHPPCRFVGVSPARPGTPLHPGETSQATKGRLTYPSAIGVGPTAYCGVELVDQGRLGPVLPDSHDATQLREVLL